MRHGVIVAEVISTMRHGILKKCIIGKTPQGDFEGQPQQAMENNMQTIQDVMTKHVQSISPEESVRRAAQIMDEFNVGSIPVCDGAKLVGMITDRDITVRSTAAGNAPESTRVGDVMSTDVRTCYASQTVDEVLGQMGDVQIRRVPVVDQQSHQLVGIVSLGDMATKQATGIEQALEDISAKTDTDRAAN